MKVYLSGPISDMPLHNFPAFAMAAANLREMGFTVISPAEMDGDDDHATLDSRPWEYYIRRDLPELVKCEAIAVLPRWKWSKGSTLEVAIARGLGMPVLDSRTGQPLREDGESILEEAERLVHGPRGEAYGPPDENFGAEGIGDAVLLQRAGIRPGEPIPAHIRGLMHIWAKLVREAYHHKRDNLVDICGYAEAVDMIWQGRAAV